MAKKKVKVKKKKKSKVNKSAANAQAAWGKRIFKINAKQINALKSLSVSDSYNPDFNENGKRIGREPTTFTIETDVVTAFAGSGKTARSEMKKWRNRVGKCAYFYLGGTKLFTKKYRLLKVDSSDIILDNKGEMLKVRLSLSFEQKATAAQDKAAKKAAKSNATSVKKSSGSPSSGSYDGGRMSWPCPASKVITSNYGMRNGPFNGREFHTGIDIGAASGSKIVAGAAGTVMMSGYNGGYGNCIIIDHGKKVYTLYAHCNSLLVKKGAEVKEKQAIAKVGSTGNSTGPHLHFEVRKGANSGSSHASPWNYVKK